MTIQSSSPRTSFGQPCRLELALGRQAGQRLAVAQAGAGPGRLLLLDQPEQLMPGGLVEALSLQRRRSGQQLVEDDAEGIDIRPRVDVEVVDLGLFRAHVKRRAHQHALGPCAECAR